MRISDWSSDVCSSDLPDRGDRRCRDQILPLVLGGKHRRKSLEALPLFGRRRESFCDPAARVVLAHQNTAFETHPAIHPYIVLPANAGTQLPLRSEEHTSELQSLMRISYAVFCL